MPPAIVAPTADAIGEGIGVTRPRARRMSAAVPSAPATAPTMKDPASAASLVERLPTEGRSTTAPFPLHIEPERATPPKTPAANNAGTPRHASPVATVPPKVLHATQAATRERPPRRPSA